MFRKVSVGIENRDIGEVWYELSEYIDKNLNSKLTVSNLAAKCFYNPSYFSRAFKEKFGVSAVEYVTRKRLERALELLRNTDMPIDEICYSSGFSERSNFYHAFSKYIGGTPSDYRIGENVKKVDKTTSRSKN